MFANITEGNDVKMSFLMGKNTAVALSSMTLDELLAYTAKDKKDAAITVGIIRGKESAYTVYGNNGCTKPSIEHVYEIASITKTFTASMLSKAIDEGMVSMEAHINEYLDLPKQEHYPTLRQLITHTSGYKNYYLEKQMLFNFLCGRRNGFYGIDTAAVLKRVGNTTLADMEYCFRYSGFGMSVVGAVLSSVYRKDYAYLLDSFIKNDLHLQKTKVTDGSGDLSGYWKWKKTDAYLPAGALSATIGDMLQYIKLHMTDALPYLARTHELFSEVYPIGMAWMIDVNRDMIFHSGGTSHFSSFAAFQPMEQLGVVVLSNFSPQHKVSAEVLGTRLMDDLQS